MYLRIRQIMEPKFTLCYQSDTVEAVGLKMIQEQTSQAVIVDERESYLGIVSAVALLAMGKGEETVFPFIEAIPAVQEDDPVALLKLRNQECIPVLNFAGAPVGVVSLGRTLEYLVQVYADLEQQPRPASMRKSHQLSAKYTINDIIGESKPILQMKEQILAAAKTRSTVLILGETGTGKELAAHAIHRLSVRRHAPFVRVNCAAIPDNLLESELFGYEAGAFTGAVKGGQSGKFELADNGTIFLDEIGDMPLALQSKILRVLQEKEIEKIGGRGPMPVDVRVIAATHQNLKQLVQDKKFREDLYYRLHVIPIQMPPLRDHREDIPLLVDYFLDKQSLELGIVKPDTDREFISALIEYDWPGNVRELANAIELSVSMANGTITKEKLPLTIREEYGRSGEEDAGVLRSYAEEAEREAIIKALEGCNGNKIKVCDILGISRSSLYNKLKKYNIDA